MNALRMALDSIREKKGRSFLTMLGIIIGVTAVLVLVALVSGYNADITAYYEKLGVNKVNVTVNWYDTSRSVDVMDTLYDYGNGELGDMVLGVSPDLSTSLPMKYRTTTLDSGTLYLGSDQFSVCGNYTLKEGRDISAFDVDRRSRVCVLGSYVADSLFQYADPIGETVYFGGEPFTVVGIYYQKDGGEEGSMDDMAVIPYSLDRAILGTAQLTRFSVKVDQSDHMDTVMAKLERFLGETIDTSVGEYELENGNSAMSESTEEMTSMSVVLGGIAGIALLVGGIGIMNIMLVTVTERTREIGIKKSIGAPRREIVGQFLVEAAILSALGGLIGIALGYLLSLILGKAMYDLILYPDALVTAGAFAFSVAIGIVFGIRFAACGRPARRLIERRNTDETTYSGAAAGGGAVPGADRGGARPGLFGCERRRAVRGGGGTLRPGYCLRVLRRELPPGRRADPRPVLQAGHSDGGTRGSGAGERLPHPVFRRAGRRLGRPLYQSGL